MLGKLAYLLVSDTGYNIQQNTPAAMRAPVKPKKYFLVE